MDRKQLFINYLEDTTNIALATADGNARIVSIGYDRTQPGTLYFTTTPDSPKAQAIAQNPAVTVLPMPDKSDTEVSIRARGTAKLSQKPVEEVAELIGKHLPEFAAEMPHMTGIGIYEINLSSAEVGLGMEPAVLITF